MQGAQAVTMKGREKHKQRLKKMSGPDLIKAAGRVLYEGADLIRSEAFVSISRASGSMGRHIPSKPGDPPHRDTGHLQGEIKFELVNQLEAQVTSEAEYAAALEFGTSRMAARPYMRPARDKKAPEIQRLFETEIDKLVKGSAT